MLLSPGASLDALCKTYFMFILVQKHMPRSRTLPHRTPPLTHTVVTSCSKVLRSGHVWAGVMPGK